jgi:LPXTG-motif cell wall-anchored protein
VKLAGMLSIATAAVAAVLLTAAFAPPAIAQSPPDSVVYFPLGNGATYSCASGPPFVVDNHHHSGDSSGNCTIQQIGPPPVGLVCDIPTTITFTHEMYPWTTDVWLCQMQYGGQIQYGIGAQAPTATGGASPARLAQTGGPPLVPLAGGAAAGLLLGGALLTTRRRRRRR